MASTASSLNYLRLDAIVQLIKIELSKPEIRSLNNRAVQAKVFQIPQVSSYMAELRRAEEALRQEIFQKMSHLICKFQEHSIDVTLARAGVLSDSRVHAGSSLDDNHLDFDLLCLDAKERLYIVLNQYEWLKDFYRFFPQHFYENSFQFVERIPPKKLHVKVKVVGLGIAGSLAVSGLKKNGVDTVIGYDRRARNGPRSVTSRFQNASWRAYDIAEKMLDEESFQHLIKYQQRITVKYDDGTSAVMSSDRVQIILGDAVDSALESAERYGATMCFDCKADAFLKNGEKDVETFDIVALFAGAHTSSLLPGLKEEMNMLSWKDLSSECRLWLEVKPSEKKYAYTARDIENGAEKWHFTIEASRDSKNDLVRIRDNLMAQHHWNLKKYDCNEDENDRKEREKQHNLAMTKIQSLLDNLEEKKVDEHIERYDYIFSNAPDNKYTEAKVQAAKEKGNVVLEGRYTVDITIASKSMIDSPCSETSAKLLNELGANVLVTGGDACVNPNPMAAYGATLACEFAAMLVQLSVAHGHINAIIQGMEKTEIMDDAELLPRLHELKTLLNQYYDTRGRSENYFQWMQTLICNLYSLPPQS